MECHISELLCYELARLMYVKVCIVQVGPQFCLVEVLSGIGWKGPVKWSARCCFQMHKDGVALWRSVGWPAGLESDCSSHHSWAANVNFAVKVKWERVVCFISVVGCIGSYFEGIDSACSMAGFRT